MNVEKGKSGEEEETDRMPPRDEGEEDGKEKRKGRLGQDCLQTLAE